MAKRIALILLVLSVSFLSAACVFNNGVLIGSDSNNAFIDNTIASSEEVSDPVMKTDETTAGIQTPGQMITETAYNTTKETADQATTETLEQTTSQNYDNSDNRIISITAVGDIMMGRGVSSRLIPQGKDFFYLYSKVSEIIGKSDIAFANLEAPITNKNHSLDKATKYVLRCPPESADGVQYCGFDIISLANNHIMDYYSEGLFDTMKALDEKSIFYFGAGKNLEEARKPVVIEKNGIKTAWLAYTDMAEILYKGEPSIRFAATAQAAGVVPRKTELILEDIAKIRSEVDIVIISLHWGIEESFIIPGDQRKNAQMLIDNGADIILGHHPHQFQGIEIYKGKPILYSLGNFIFDQNDPENKESFIIEMKYENDILKSMEALPIRIVNKVIIEPQYGEEALSMLERQIKLCAELDTVCRQEGDILVFEIEQP